MQTGYGKMAIEEYAPGKVRMVQGGIAGTRLQQRARESAGSSPAPAPLYRSKLEAAWANYLDVRKAVKDIDGWKYEPMNFRLPGQKNFYKIDFSAWVGREVTLYEVKGRNKSDERSLVKIKTAAGLNPWAVFIQVKRSKGVWEERCIQPNT